MSTNKIILPEFGVIKDGNGKSVWGRLPYEFTFTNKEEYLTWRKVWKDTYKELSLKIREEKKLRNEGFRNKLENAYTLQYSCLKMKEEARTLMQILSDAKVRSWAQKTGSFGK